MVTYDIARTPSNASNLRQKPHPRRPLFYFRHPARQNHPHRAVALGGFRYPGRPDIFLSLSHSGAYLLVGVSHAPVGVDIECIKPRRVLPLAETIGHPDEYAMLARLPPEQQQLAFLECWTRKEAWLKARGLGLSFATLRTLQLKTDVACPDTLTWQMPDAVLSLHGTMDEGWHAHWPSDSDITRVSAGAMIESQNSG